MASNPTPHRRQGTAWLVVAALAILQLAPLASRRGIFLDGLVYATISRNLAVGIGDACHPVYTNASTQSRFRDHPPLAFWLESLAFRALGDHWWVEKFYSITATLLTGGLIGAIWRWLTRGEPEGRSLAWLPVGMWVLLPCWQWTAANNLLENTLSVFAVAAVYCSLRAQAGGRAWPAWSAAAAAAILAGLLSKGVVGLFPLAAPLIATACFRGRWRQGIGLNGLIALLVFGGLGLLLLRLDCREYFCDYFDGQVLRSLKGQRETHPSIIGRAHILWEIVFTLSISIAFAWTTRWLARRREPAFVGARGLRPAALAMLLIGLAASCPVAISPKQTNFYITPSYPFYVLALSLWCAGELNALRGAARGSAWPAINRYVRLASVAAILIAVGVSGCWLGQPRRDREALAIATAIGRCAPAHATIDTPADVAREWALLGYLYRDHFISLEPHGARREFRLIRKDSPPPPGYRQVAVEMPRYRLLRRIELLSAERATGALRR